MKLLKPLIEQRADPFVYKHSDGYYYFTASVPAYDRIEVRRAKTIAGLAEATPVDVWHKPETGPLSDLIWAPEIHFHDGSWYVYFAAAPSREIKDDLFQHRMYAISTDSANPLEGKWTEPVQIETGMDSFCLDATTFRHRGKLYYLWAQKDPAITGNSNLYIAPMETPVKLAAKPVMLSKPEFDWEIRGFWVNEGPAVIVHAGRIFITYSASATDENYCMGLLWTDEDADLLDPANWNKSPGPIFQSCYQHGIYGPGHSCFTSSEDGRKDLLVYHARTYTDIQGDPLWDPNRHTFVKEIGWKNGMPDLGRPSCA
ncbi:MAG: putative Alpha-N-arabinofuranosidase 2 precursor [Puniceicoccaceae bacterium 5H]|nr:MAG: putative Alpha-N-arabinofuranosidase 2 precursor [Puniceicoccaceae bacterium 5H]